MKFALIKSFSSDLYMKFVGVETILSVLCQIGDTDGDTSVLPFTANLLSMLCIDFRVILR